MTDQQQEAKQEQYCYRHAESMGLSVGWPIYNGPVSSTAIGVAHSEEWAKLICSTLNAFSPSSEEKYHMKVMAMNMREVMSLPNRLATLNAPTTDTISSDLVEKLEGVLQHLKGYYMACSIESVKDDGHTIEEAIAALSSPTTDTVAISRELVEDINQFYEDRGAVSYTAKEMLKFQQSIQMDALLQRCLIALSTKGKP